MLQSGLNISSQATSLLGMASIPLSIAGVGGAAFGSGSGLMMGMLGGPVGVGLMAAGAGAHFAGVGLQQAGAVNQMFGNMQFYNPFGGNPQTGRGFSQSQLNTIQRGITAIGENNPFVSMTDALRATERFTEMGMHQGVQDAEKLAKRVTELGKTLHKMARALGTSMEESSRFFEQMRGAGFYTSADVMGNTASMTFMRGMGMSSQAFSQLLMGGAGMTRGQGMSGKAGGTSVRSVAELLSLGMTSGIGLSGTEMMDITGAQTPADAIAAMSQQVLGSTLQGLSGGAGTLLLSALGTTNQEGRFKGGIDLNLLKRLQTGDLSLQDLKTLGQQKTSTMSGKESFVTRQQDIKQALLETGEGSDAVLALIDEIAKESGKTSEDQIALIAQTQFEMDRRTLRALQKMRDSRKMVNDARTQRIEQERITNENAAANREMTLGGLYQSATGTLEDVQTDLAQPFSRFSRRFTAEAEGIERLVFGGGPSFGVTTGGLSQQARTAAMETLRGGDYFSQVVQDTVGLSSLAQMTLNTENTAQFGAALAPNYGGSLLGAGGVIDAREREALNKEILSIREIADPDKRRKAVQDLRERVRRRLMYANKPHSDREVDAYIGHGSPDNLRLLAEVVAEDGLVGTNLRFAEIERAQESATQAFSGFAGTDVNPIQAAAASALAFPVANPLLKLGAGAVSGIGAMTLNAATKTDLGVFLDEFKSGGPLMDLAAIYDKNQVDIDSIISDSIQTSPSTEKGYEKAAERIRRRYGINITSEQLGTFNSVLSKQLGNKSASERARGLTKDEKGKISKIAAGAVTSQRAMAGSELENTVDRLIRSVSVDSFEGEQAQQIFKQGTQGNKLENLGAVIAAASAGNFQADTTTEQQLIERGVGVYQNLRALSAGGLTPDELRKAGLDGASIDELVRTRGLQGGAFRGDVAEEIVRTLSAAESSAYGTAEGARAVLRRGKTTEDIFSESVITMAETVTKTAEMVDKVERAVSNNRILTALFDPED
jgi:hypothetical protein